MVRVRLHEINSPIERLQTRRVSLVFCVCVCSRSNRPTLYPLRVHLRPSLKRSLDTRSGPRLFGSVSRRQIHTHVKAKKEKKRILCGHTYHRALVDRIQAHHCYMEENYRRFSFFFY